ncbi:MAG: signal peptidase II [bacterium]
MNDNKKNFNIFAKKLLFISFLIAIDQIVKYKIRQNGGFYICNSGISFSIPMVSLFFWIFFGFFLLLSAYYYKKLLKSPSYNKIKISLLTLLMAGAISNSTDRLLLGCITDFIHIKKTIFPIFNIADIYIFIGSFLFLTMLFTKKE